MFYICDVWKMWCEVVLPKNKIRGETTEHYSYQTLSIYRQSRVKHQPENITYVPDIDATNIAISQSGADYITLTLMNTEYVQNKLKDAKLPHSPAQYLQAWAVYSAHTQAIFYDAH